MRMSFWSFVTVLVGALAVGVGALAVGVGAAADLHWHALREHTPTVIGTLDASDPDDDVLFLKEIIEKLTGVAERYSLTYNEVDWLAPLYLPIDHPLIVSLLRVYRDVTGDQETPPMTSGGATLARAIPNCVAYGPNLPTTPITEHQPNEYMVLKDLFTAMEVYAYAIYEITR